MCIRDSQSTLSKRVKKLDFLIALGTHPAMTSEQIREHFGVTPSQAKVSGINIFNHQWDKPSQLKLIGTLAEEQVKKITGGLLAEPIPVNINKKICLLYTSMLHSTLLLDEEGDPLYPLLNWMDTRCQDELKSLNQEYQEKRFYFRNGVPLHTIYNLPRLIWFRKHYPSFLQSAWKIEMCIRDRYWSGAELKQVSVPPSLPAASSGMAFERL